MRIAPYIVVVLAGVLASSLLDPPRRAEAPSSIMRDTGVRALGAARGYASVALWLRAGEAYRRGDLYETMATYQLIRELQPRNPAVYSYLAWNQAYNIAAQFKDAERRSEWLARGFETLRQGRRALPQDAGLLFDEWSFVLNRAVGLPRAVLQIELPARREADPQWALIAEYSLRLHEELPPAERAALDEFLEESGMQTELAQTAGFADLPAGTQRVLQLWDWCRAHLMVLVLQPATALSHRPLSIDLCLLNSLLLARQACPEEARAEFEPRYRRGVASAFAAGIENALKHGGQELRAEFESHVRENYSRLPGWLP